MGKIIGIDLGTTNSCVAVMEGNEPHVIINSDGARTTPSIVAFTDKGEQLVGQPAKNQMVTNAANTIYSIKRFMGHKYQDADVQQELGRLPYKVTSDAQGYVRVVAQGKEYSPEQISAAILQKMKAAAEAYLKEPVTEAVITVPAYFNDAQRQATKDAGKIAGLDVKRIVNEPTASALAYGLDKTNKEEKIAVYDFGGGTFDVSILELGDGVFEVKSTNGDTHLGGDDFDAKIIDWMNEEFKAQYGINLKDDTMALQRMKEEAEKAKIALSSTMNYTISLPFIANKDNRPLNLQMDLSRAHFEAMTADLVERSRGPVTNALRDAGLTIHDIDEVILVGGTTRIPAVQEAVKEMFGGKEPMKGVNPDEVVAMGAAIQGGILGGTVKDVVLLDVTPLSLGIETLGGVCTKMIPRNTTIPTHKSQIFTTAADGQTEVGIKVLQGEREMAAQNRVLGTFTLDQIPAAPRGVPQIEVSFDIDVNGIVHVSAKDTGTGKEAHIKIESSSGLSDEEIDRMVKEAKDHADEDKKAKEKVDARNNAETMMYSTEKSLKSYGDKISADDKAKIEKAIADLKSTLSNSAASTDELKAKTQALQEASYKLAEEIYKHAGANNQNGGAQGGSANGGAQGGATSGPTTHQGTGPDDAGYEVVN